MCLKNLWNVTRMWIECGNSISLPSYVFVAFTHPRITRCLLEKGGIAASVTSRCVGALVVNKLATDIKSGILPLNDAELACLSAILHSESRDVKLCLTQPGIVEVVNTASLVLGHSDPLNARGLPLDLRGVLQQTLGILSQALPLQENTEIHPDQTVTMPNISGDKFGYTVVSRLHNFLKICVQGVSPLTEEVRTACLRMCLKNLWLSCKAYHRTSTPLPPYFPHMLSSPDIIRHFQAEKDPVVRLTGCCFGALISSKLADTLKSPVSFSTNDQDAKLACISAILGPGHREGLLTPYKVRIINFQKIVSLISDEIDAFFTDSEGVPVDILPRNILVDTAEITLYNLADRLHDSKFIPQKLPVDQHQLLQGTYSDIGDAFGLYRREHETVNALDRLQTKLLLWNNLALYDDNNYYELPVV
jgi:hypothetical protein